MGYRETLTENSRTVAVVVGVVVVLALGWVVYNLRGSGKKSGVVERVTKVYYSEDDGATFYPDTYDKAAGGKGPNGKDAVRAYVWQFGNEKPFVAWLERYTPNKGQKLLATYYADPQNKDKAPPQLPQYENERQVKKPGAGNRWVNVVGEQAQIAQTVARMPLREGSGDTPGMLSPE